jgi:hypothetical protein
MPISRGKDGQGPYFRFRHGPKYHYIAGDAASRERARKRARAEWAAERARNTWKGPVTR